jgi:hypothetical protein
MVCELCRRDVPRVTLHHLVPRATHSDRVKRELGEERNRKVALCVGCHRQVHKFFENKRLGKEYDTLEALRLDPGIAKYVEWVSRRPGDFVPPKCARAKGRRG